MGSKCPEIERPISIPEKMSEFASDTHKGVQGPIMR
jgi:hypothetical protein